MSRSLAAAVWLLFLLGACNLASMEATIVLPASTSNTENEESSPVANQLILAADKGDLAKVKALLGKHPDEVNSIDENGCSALIHAAGKGHLDVVQELIATSGIDLFLQNEAKRTALMVAATRGHKHIVKALLSCMKGEGLDLMDEDGRSVLLLTVREPLPRLEILEALLQEAKLDVNLQDKAGESAFLVAAIRRSHPTLKALLTAKGIDVNLPDENGRGALFWAALKSDPKTAALLLEQAPGINANLQDKAGDAALSFSTKYGDLAMVKALLDSSSTDVNLQSSQDGRTPLMVAITSRHDAIAEALLEAPKMKIDVNKATKEGFTALMLAAVEGKLSILRKILANPDVNVGMQNKDHETAEDVARAYSHIECAEVLHEAAAKQAEKASVSKAKQAVSSYPTTGYLALFFQTGLLALHMQILRFPDGLERVLGKKAPLPASLAVASLTVLLWWGLVHAPAPKGNVLCVGIAAGVCAVCLLLLALCGSEGGPLKQLQSKIELSESVWIWVSCSLSSTMALLLLFLDTSGSWVAIGFWGGLMQTLFTAASLPSCSPSLSVAIGRAATGSFVLFVGLQSAIQLGLPCSPAALLLACSNFALGWADYAGTPPVEPDTSYVARAGIELPHFGEDEMVDVGTVLSGCRR